MVLPDINGALDVFAPLYDVVRRRRRLRVASRSIPAWPTTPTGTDRRGPRSSTDDRPPEPVGEDPGHRRGLAGDPADDRRGPQHQRHADLQPRPLRRGDGGLPRRARGYARSRAPTCPRAPASASFFISRVDTEVDRRLDAIGIARGAGPPGQGAPSPRASSPTSCSRRRSAGPRWEALAARGARVQRPLWASTSTKNPAYPDTLYVDELIGPDTVDTLPDATIEAFADHGTLARTVDADVDEAERGVGRPRPRSASTSTTSPRCSSARACASFQKSFDELLDALDDEGRPELPGLGWTNRLASGRRRPIERRSSTRSAPGDGSTSLSRAARARVIGHGPEPTPTRSTSRSPPPR